MKWTKSPRVAMERIAPLLGWQVISSGRAWRITGLPYTKGLTYTATSALCFMTRVAMASKEQGGLGMDKEELREMLRFRPDHIYSPKHNRWFLKLPRKIAATDETTMYTYFNPEKEND